VAFALVHHFRFSGPGGGELPWVYMGGFLAVFFAGPGRFSVDGGGSERMPRKRY